MSDTTGNRPRKALAYLTKQEFTSDLDRLEIAEALILQLPKNHDGRNSWILNYGIGEEAAFARLEKRLILDPLTRAAKPQVKDVEPSEPRKVGMNPAHFVDYGEQ